MRSQKLSQSKVGFVLLVAWAIGLAACQDFKADPTENYRDLGLNRPPHNEKPKVQQAYDRMFTIETNDNSVVFDVNRTQKYEVVIRFLQPVTDAAVALKIPSLGLEGPMVREARQPQDAANVFRYSATLNLKGSQKLSESQKAAVQFHATQIEVTSVKSDDATVIALFNSLLAEHKSAIAVHVPVTGSESARTNSQSGQSSPKAGAQK